MSLVQPNIHGKDRHCYRTRRVSCPRIHFLNPTLQSFGRRNRADDIEAGEREQKDEKDRSMLLFSLFSSWWRKLTNYSLYHRFLLY